MFHRDDLIPTQNGYHVPQNFLGSTPVHHLLNSFLLRLIRRLRRPTQTFSTHEIHFHSSAGYRIAATLLVPKGASAVPAVVLCPGGMDDRRVFFDDRAPIQAAEIASMGVAVLCHDPSGRGGSWGPEDWGGLEHQDNVAQAVRWLRTSAPVAVTQVGLLTMSLGLSSAVGGAKLLAHDQMPVSWVIDWEGPNDRTGILASYAKNGQKLARRLNDTVFWEPREPNRHIQDISAGYWRLQTSCGEESVAIEEAQAMLTAAATGGLPWVQLNRHQRGDIPAQLRLLSSGRLDANRTIRHAVDVAIQRS